jgi:hypothetical protein
MKYITLLTLLSLSSFGQTLEGTYEFDSIENKTPQGWNEINIIGKVVFDKYEVNITTPYKEQNLYVVTKQFFIKKKTYFYRLVDDNYKEIKVVIVVKDTLNTIDLYYYPDSVDDKKYKLKLVKCL